MKLREGLFLGMVLGLCGCEHAGVPVEVESRAPDAAEALLGKSSAGMAATQQTTKLVTTRAQQHLVQKQSQAVIATFERMYIAQPKNLLITKQLGLAYAAAGKFAQAKPLLTIIQNSPHVDDDVRAALQHIDSVQP